MLTTRTARWSAVTGLVCVVVLVATWFVLVSPRRSQAAGIRMLSFRHEQNAGYAASIAGFLTQKPGICLTVSAPGFLNGLNALAHATVNCFPMILISGSSEREIVDLQQGD